MIQRYISIDICEQLYLKEKVVHGNKLRRLPKNTWPVAIIGMPPIEHSHPSIALGHQPSDGAL